MNFPDNIKYTKEHEWIRVEGEEAYVGITDYAQSQLGDIVFVEVESLDEQIKEIARIVRKSDSTLHSLEILDAASSSRFKRHKNTTVIKALIFPRDEYMIDSIINSIRKIDGIVDLYVD